MRVWNEQHGFSHISVGEAHSAWESWLFIDGYSANSHAFQLLVALREKRPEELGWQDTAHVDPSTMISVVAEFDKPGDYVWHCHILSHEDNEMMRPFTVSDSHLA